MFKVENITTKTRKDLVNERLLEEMGPKLDQCRENMDILSL